MSPAHLHLYLSRVPDTVTDAWLQARWSCLNAADTARLRQYTHAPALHLCLHARYVLLHALRAQGYTGTRLPDFAENAWKRPFIPGFPDFNMSHSGDCVLVGMAAETGIQLGVDVEAVQAVYPEDFRLMFQPGEMEEIRSAGEDMALFFRLWTRKEAILKADGRGMYLAPGSFAVPGTPGGGQAHAGGRRWHYEEIPAGPGHAAAVAASQPFSWTLHTV